MKNISHLKKSAKVFAIIEARMTSRRLPGKVLLQVMGKPMLELMIERLSKARTLDGIIIATTVNATDDPVVELAQQLGIRYHRGSEHDVLSRVIGAATEHDIDIIVEIPGDCPLIDPLYVDLCVNEYIKNEPDYVSSALSNSFPHGTEAQVFSTKTLQDVASRTNDPVDREHVSLYMYNNPHIYSIQSIVASEEVAKNEIHLTLDEQKDYELISTIFEHFYPENKEFTLIDILSYLDSTPGLLDINAHVNRTVI